MNKYAYYLGKVAAMEELGIEDTKSDAEEKPEPEMAPEPAEAAPDLSTLSPEEQALLIQLLQQLQGQGGEMAPEMGGGEMAPEMGAEMGAEGMGGGEEMGMPGAGLSSEDFAQFAQQDGAEQEADPNAEEIPDQSEDEKGPNWSGKSSLEGGDAATRMMQLGVPGTQGA